MTGGRKMHSEPQGRYGWRAVIIWFGCTLAKTAITVQSSTTYISSPQSTL